MQRVTNWIQGGDITTFFILNRSWKCPVTDFLMPIITNFGGAIWSIALSLILLVSKNSFWHKSGVQLATSLLISHLVVQLCKRFLPRRRPYQALQNVYTGPKLYQDASFPSGHSTAAFCIATVFSTILPALSILFFLLALLVAVSRVYLGMHYPSDITVGAILGVATAVFMA
ncbi:MAG: phosphatase PAP2 family protein [Desulfitobacterium hafniense]|nr:phosphatase PAP2 family protein [Desulfitobacterium hafniense]